MRHRPSRIAILLLLTAGSFAARAAIISSVDRAAFQAAVVSQQIAQQNFDSLPAGTVLSTLTGVTYGASTGSPVVTDFYLTSTGANGLGRTGVGFFLSSDSASFSFATPISAFAIDINTFANLAGDYRATLDIGDVVTSLNEVFPNRTTGQFIGFVSNAAFSSVTITANPASTSPNRSYTLDTLVYGNAEAVTTPVPEPATGALMALGLGFVGLRGWRSKKLSATVSAQ